MLRLPRAVAQFATAVSAVSIAVTSATPALAETARIDAADTAWMITATALVLMMTIPGLALFYAGMVRKKNVLATMAQSLIAVALISILWVIYGYSLVFVGDGAWLGTLERFLLAGMTMDGVSSAAKTIPEALFVIYQMTFAVITVALVAGSVADRLRFSSYVLFCIGWFTVVYIPLAHWVWGGGFLAQAGVLDFAGGLVVHLSAGTAGLVAAVVMGRRRGYGTENLAPYDLSLAVIGTGLLWVGWFGFNGGSALQANSRAVMAILATHLAACAGALTWTAIEWLTRRKPSVLGMISGAVAGLGTITPASGFVEPWHGIVIGVVAGAVCFWACTNLKHRFNYDDTLDVFGIHGIGGLLGTLMTGVFATAAIGGSAGLIEGNPRLLLIQAYGVAAVFVWTGAMTFVLLKVVDMLAGLRVPHEHEVEGLDITQHGEALQ
ncbi:MAG TPA: ammonium transporter [Afipia sp.]|uniref:ammonium transporter n=1 Tax=unclassified Afipia TaxID=2642050 RepID=UPI0004636394|nr:MULTISPECIES: ammonium transporter [unclassified Afipia]MAH70882.1 ammonium transporter [Afipia sp.]OUX59999.1 MAG: ammonia channel protein [Afipia sp. TMED4]HAO39779.1 ammonium transporter [Afipia sp.]HAP09634.1 ammonium transporter [Afipia sp.]HBF55557.1 ammonium transporter [Afipia sp.]